MTCVALAYFTQLPPLSGFQTEPWVLACWLLAFFFSSLTTPCFLLFRLEGRKKHGILFAWNILPLNFIFLFLKAQPTYFRKSLLLTFPFHIPQRGGQSVEVVPHKLIHRQSHIFPTWPWEGVSVYIHKRMHTTRVAAVAYVVFGACAWTTHTQVTRDP